MRRHILVCLFSLPSLLMTSACGPKTGGLSPVKIPANNDAAEAPTMDAEAAALQLAEFDLSKSVTITPDRIAEAAAHLSFPKTILLGPGSTETTALQITPAAMKIMASECDNVMPALDRISGKGETLTFDFGYDYSACAKREWEKDGSTVDGMKYQVSQHMTLTCPGANYNSLNGKSLQELELKKQTNLLACNYNGTDDITYTFKLLFVTVTSGIDKDGIAFSADQRLSKMLTGANGPCSLNSAGNIVTVKECFQNDRAQTAITGIGEPTLPLDVVGKLDMSGFSASRNVRYYAGTNPATVQVNNWTGSAIFDGTAKANLTLTNGTESFDGTLTP